MQPPTGLGLSADELRMQRIDEMNLNEDRPEMSNDYEDKNSQKLRIGWFERLKQHKLLIMDLSPREGHMILSCFFGPLMV